MLNEKHLVTGSPLSWNELRGYDGVVCCHEREGFAEYVVLCKKHQMVYSLMNICVEIEEAGLRLPHEKGIDKITQENVNEDYEATILRVAR